MPERRTKQIMVNIEPTFTEVAARYANDQEISLSMYVRVLIIRDLLTRGYLTGDDFQRVTVGDVNGASEDTVA